MSTGRVFALLVGIDAYLPPVNALYGCRNDIAALDRYLNGRLGDRLVGRTLVDAEATRASVTAAFREHLGSAGTGDVALFAYCGHGSEEPAPAAVAHLEPTGRIQTLMLHDAGRRVDGALQPALADKELALLIAELAARGPHVVVILDCCNSGHGTRDPHARPRGWQPPTDRIPPEHREFVLGLQQPRPAIEFLPGTIERWTDPAAPHVALSACRSFETAKEYRAGETTRGAFSVALGDALDVLGPEATYRSLLATVGSRVERMADQQHPELFPVDAGGPGDGSFLEGTIPPVSATYTVTRGLEGWRVDAGLVHGLRPANGEEAFVLACRAPDGSEAGAVRVTDVDIGTSVVVPIGWEPADVAYAATVADVPLPAAEVAFDLVVDGADSGHLAGVRDVVTSALERGGPAGGASPYVRIAPDGGGSAEALRLRVGASGPLLARIGRADGSTVTVDTPVDDEAGARLVVARLEHVARWEQVRSLGDHPSPLRDAVVLDVYDADDGQRDPGQHPLAAVGGHRLVYRAEPGGTWTPPAVFLDVRSTVAEDLYVAVVDLTDRFRCHALLPTVRLAAGHTLALRGGAALPVALPDERPVRPGAMVKDWLKVIVSDVDFDAHAFDLAALDEPVTRSAARRSAPTTLERIAARALTRDFDGGSSPVVARWAATTVTFETVVPST